MVFLVGFSMSWSPQHENNCTHKKNMQQNAVTMKTLENQKQPTNNMIFTLSWNIAKVMFFFTTWFFIVKSSIAQHQANNKCSTFLDFVVRQVSFMFLGFPMFSWSGYVFSFFFLVFRSVLRVRTPQNRVFPALQGRSWEVGALDSRIARYVGVAGVA